MLFHLGALWRLNEAGLLPKLQRVSSVSGGSITAGILGLKWPSLDFDKRGVARRFVLEVVEPIRLLADRTVDVMAVLVGLFTPVSAADEVARAYAEHLFGKATLQDLPDHPRFVFNATNLQSGALWRFSKPYMRDYRVGEVINPTIPLAVAVAASAAFPPFLSPLTLSLPATAYSPSTLQEDLHREPFTTRVTLSDGGVYDNLGLETVWKRYETVLVSDGGAKMSAQAEPPHHWLGLLKRVLDTIDNQVRSLRVHQVIDSLSSGQRRGAYWGIRTDVARYGVPDALPCPIAVTSALAKLPTRLARLTAATQESLINWGYAVSDAALRRHLDPNLPPPTGFIYPGGVTVPR